MGFPSLCSPGWPATQPSGGRDAKHLAPDPGLASPTVVANFPASDRGLAIAIALAQDPTPHLVGGEAARPPAAMGMDRTAAIRAAFTARGLSEGAIHLTFQHYKHGEEKGMNKQHDNMWPRWRNWRTDERRDLLAFRSTDVANCLSSEIIDEGLGLRWHANFYLCARSHTAYYITRTVTSHR